MRRKLPLLLLLLLPAALGAQEPAQSFQLPPGEFRWVEFTVRQVPTEVECSYEVIGGQPAVHAEMMPRSEFRLLYRGEDHSSMTRTPAASSGRFRQLIAEKGRYVLVLMNDSGSRTARATLDFRTTIEPRAEDVARGLDPRRRLAVILISFAVFFVTVVWTGRKLLRVMRF